MNASKAGRSGLLGLASVIAMSAVVLAGCANSRASMEKKIADLEREVTRLQAERANLASRNGALDDRVVVLEKKVRGCGKRADGDGAGKLEVVRLGPKDERAEEAREERIPFAAKAEAEADDAKRPVLVLTGEAPRIGGGQGGLAAPSAERILPTGLGDNLGVVGAAQANGATAGDLALEEFHEAYRLYANKSHQAALDGFSRFLRDHPDHDFADNALFWRGECYFAMGGFLKAIGEYERLVSRYPKSEKGPFALYRIGFVYDQLRDRAKAEEYYFKVVENYPGTDAAQRASRRMAAIREGEGGSLGAVPTSARR